jgi:hypothetical protein
VLAVTDGDALLVSGDDGGVDEVLLAPVAGSETIDGSSCTPAVIAPIVMRPPAATAAAPTLKFRFLRSIDVTSAYSILCRVGTSALTLPVLVLCRWCIRPARRSNTCLSNS